MTIIEHASLRTAIAAARRGARPLVKTEPGGKTTKRHGERRDPTEHWWYYAPTEVVMEEATRLLREHGLELEWIGSDLGARGQVVSRWELSHTASGERREYTYGAPPFPDSETQTHAVLGTTRHAERAVHLLVLQIPMVEQPREGDVVEGGIIVSRRAEAAPPKPPAPRQQGAEWESEPLPEFWEPPVPGDSDGTGGGLVDPGPLGGEDPEPADHNPAELAAPRQQGAEWESEPLPEFWEPPVPGDSDGTGGGLVDPGPLGGEDPEPADHNPAELAAEADAAAVGRVAPAPEVDTDALWEAVRRWGKATGHGGKSTLAEALKQAHGGAAGVDWARAPIIGSPEALARREQLVAFLREGGHL